MSNENHPQQDNIFKMIGRFISPTHFFNLFRRGFNSITQQGFEATWRKIMFRVNLALHRDTFEYRSDMPLRKELKAQRNTKWNTMPLISIVVPLYNTPMPFFKQMVESVIAQTYPNWQLVLADASDSSFVERNQEWLKPKDKRILYFSLPENKGIAHNTNAALQKAGGDYIALFDHDDLLQPNALYDVVKAIQETGADFLYSDEAVISGDLKSVLKYHFKPGFGFDTLRGCNYITHLSVFSKQLLDKAGFERAEYDGAQDFDLILRLCEQASKIHHIPKVLYFWRSHASSTASDISAAKPYALEAGRKAVQAHLERMGLDGRTECIPNCPGAYRVRYKIHGTPLVSVLIPNKDHIDDLNRCLEALYQTADNTNFEVIVIENNSTNPETFAYYETMQAKFDNCRMVKYQGKFNFSAINNFGRTFAKGDHLLLMNNDLQPLSKNFIGELLQYSQRADVGAVGAKLFYPDDTIQHAGVFIGIGGSAGHSHKSHPRDSGGDMYRLATTQNMSAVTGACLMVKTALYDKMGGLDEQNFAVAYNDIDFCLKLRQEGYVNIFTPFAQAYHYESKSRGSDAAGENKKRYLGEKQRFSQKYAAMMCEGGDPYYNPHFTLLYENYGYK